MTFRSPVKREAHYAKIREDARRWRDEDDDIPSVKTHLSEKSQKILDARSQRPDPPLWDEHGCLIHYQPRANISRTPLFVRTPREKTWDPSPRIVRRQTSEISTPQRPRAASVSHRERSLARERLFRAGRPVTPEPVKTIQSRAVFEEFFLRQSDFSKEKSRIPLRRSQSMSFISPGSALILQKTKRDSSLYDLPSPARVPAPQTPARSRTPRAKRSPGHLETINFDDERDRLEIKKVRIIAESLEGKTDECTFRPRVNKRVPVACRRTSEERISDERKRIREKAEELENALETLELTKKHSARPVPEFIRKVSRQIRLGREEDAKRTRRRRHSFAG